MSDLAQANQLIAALYANIGLHLRAAREARGVTQEDLGTAMGVRRPSVANIESGRQHIQLHAMIAACQALGVDPADIITKAVEGIDPLTSPFPPGTTRQTERLRKNLLTAQTTIQNILDELPGN